LTGEERRDVPAGLLELHPDVWSRVGIDIAPIDVTTAEGALLLKSFVWADQTWRLDRLDRSIAALRKDPPGLVRGDVATLLGETLAQRRRSSALTVVWQTAVLSYLSSDRRQQVRDALEDAGRREPLAFIGTTAPSDGDQKHYGL
jgi:hypothetical protein